MPSGYPFGDEVRARYFELISTGMSSQRASAAVGVSRAGTCKWRQAAGVDLDELKLAAARASVLATGLGLDPTLPRRPGERLTVQDRVAISCGIRHGLTIAEIGREIARDRSVVWREVHRNSGADGVYRPGPAGALAAVRALRPKPFKLAGNPELCRRIENWLDDGWSPKLISQVLSRLVGQDGPMTVSHETIYQCLYVQTRGELRKDLCQQLSLKHRARVPVKKDRGEQRRGKFNDVLTISDRPAEAADRAVPGHWEGDLIIGAGGQSAIGTLVERSTRFTLLLHLPGRRTADEVATAMIAAMKDLPEHLRRSMTWDRGVEMAAYNRIRMELGTPVYFCDPHSPWQRGTNENTNRLLRHWFTKGTDLRPHTAADLKRVQDTLNRRPRPTLDLDTPADRLNQLILQTAA